MTENLQNIDNIARSEGNKPGESSQRNDNIKKSEGRYICSNCKCIVTKSYINSITNTFPLPMLMREEMAEIYSPTPVYNNVPPTQNLRQSGAYIQ
ncbi:hypothetical protein Glove_143g19 [Diversispora epigaea]|uniref:Uncharacterized protein n=1 Tax=Diversispora epigaea TaxID=1348612 RepID=A0A397J0Y0_9GLOM|nr:hypothetical protein Glove_143g19 [Diversispora epigaea]